MRRCRLHLATALTLFAVPVLSACSSTCAVTRTGQTVTKEVPHSSETVSDIKEREAKEPLPPRGDVAIPSHRVQRGDNTAAPTPPAGKPAGMEKPGEPSPPGTGGY